MADLSQIIREIREDIARSNARLYLENVNNLGYSFNEAVELLKKAMEDE
mgnify:CR=1 FL=1